MSKRLIRIRPDDAFIRLENKSGIEINAVLQNGNTYFGVMNSVTKEHLYMSDTRNHAHCFALTDLFEIILDVESLEKIVFPK